MTPDLLDMMRAIDDLAEVLRKMWDFEPLWDQDELAAKRAMAVLHAWVKEHNQP